MTKPFGPMAQVPCYCMLVHHHKLRAGRLWQEWPLRIVWDLIQDDLKSGGKPHGENGNETSKTSDFGWWRFRVEVMEWSKGGGYEALWNLMNMIGDYLLDTIVDY